MKASKVAVIAVVSVISASWIARSLNKRVPGLA